MSTIPPQDQQRFAALGKLAWLWMQSPLQREWDLATAARYLLPPIELQQFQLIERAGFPVAYCSWALLSEAIEMRYLEDPASIEPSEWKSGDRLWLVDWVAPFSGEDSWTLRRALKTRFADQVARAIRVKREQTRGRVVQVHGPALDKRQARARLAGYYDGFRRFVQSNNGASLRAAAPDLYQAAIRGSSGSGR